MLADVSGQSPQMKSIPRKMNTMIAATLIDENQYSNSPNARTEARFVPVINASKTRLVSQTGAPGSHLPRMAPPATASIAITTTQKYQYIQPIENPAQGPIPSRAYS